jgi:hypothetical protein
VDQRRMPLEGGPRLGPANVPEPHGPITVGRDQHRAVRREGDLVDLVPMALQDDPLPPFAELRKPTMLTRSGVLCGLSGQNSPRIAWSVCWCPPSLRILPLSHARFRCVAYLLQARAARPAADAGVEDQVVRGEFERAPHLALQHATQRKRDQPEADRQQAEVLHQVAGLQEEEAISPFPVLQRDAAGVADDEPEQCTAGNQP